MKTLDEAIAYLKSLGLHACERVLSRERVIFVGVEPVVSQAGLTAFKKGVYIRQFNHSWTILEMNHLFPASFPNPMSLREACDTAAALLADDLRISIAA